MNKKFALSVALPFIGAIPIVILGVFQSQIIEMVGRNLWTIFMIIAVIIVIVFSIWPFVGIFKKMFGGKGYGFFWGNGKLAKQILAGGKPAKATLVSIGENSGGGVITINDQPLMNLTFRVEEGDTPPYEVSFDTIVS